MARKTEFTASPQLDIGDSGYILRPFYPGEWQPGGFWAVDATTARGWGTMSKIWDAMKQAERERERLHIVSDEEGYRPLTTRQLTAVAALSETGSLSEACRRSGVSERTMLRWLSSAQFAAAYRKATHDRYTDALSSLRSASVEAVETLRGALGAESEEIRVQAAIAILNLASKGEQSEVIGRVTRGERAKKGSKQPG